MDARQLTPLAKIPSEELTPLPFLDELEHRRKSKLAKELLTKMMTADCKNVKDSKDISKEKANERGKRLQDELGKYLEYEGAQKDLLEKLKKKMQQESENA